MDRKYSLLEKEAAYLISWATVYRIDVEHEREARAKGILTLLRRKNLE